eukprot:scaffold897_cov402-Prasinococcus_capsulatus_cf.AAC.54
MSVDTLGRGALCTLFELLGRAGCRSSSGPTRRVADAFVCPSLAPSDRLIPHTTSHVCNCGGCCQQSRRVMTRRSSGRCACSLAPRGAAVAASGRVGGSAPSTCTGES